MRHDVPGWAWLRAGPFRTQTLIREGKIKMRKVLLGTGLVAAALTASANANFLGFAAKSYITTVGTNSYTTIDVYAMFSSTSNKLLNIFNTNITLTGATQFYQAGSGGSRSYNPDALFDSATGENINAADSFATIGGIVPIWDPVNEEYFNANPTSPDPNFTNWSGAGSLNPPVPLAGWFCPNPNGNAWGVHNAAKPISGLTDNDTGSNLGVMLGRFSVAGIPDGVRKLNFAGQLKWNNIGQVGSQDGQDSKVFKYIPAPGAFALLGLAGLAGRRRRA